MSRSNHLELKLAKSVSAIVIDASCSAVQLFDYQYYILHRCPRRRLLRRGRVEAMEG